MKLSRVVEAAVGNQAAPSALRRGDAGWREDLLAYDLLPEELRLAVQDTPFEADALGVLLAWPVTPHRRSPAQPSSPTSPRWRPQSSRKTITPCS